MFGLLRGKVDKGPPTGDVLNFELGSLELRFPKPLPEGPHEVLLQIAEALAPGSKPFPARVLVETYLKEKDLHWATLEESPDALAKLYLAYPAVAEEAAAVEAELVWEEKRAEPRLQRVMGIMSPDIQGFKALTWDTSLTGVRLTLNQEFAPGRPIKLRLELDDHRIPPLDLQGMVLWTKPVPAKSGTGFWSGVQLVNVPERTTEVLRKFIEEALSTEHGVLSRDYVAD
jgi:hypothetical protein